ncbi:hypothetical protein [Borrelia miyamotoi]|uniref:hypothetical protein n=1 Tax=Borrelia miyamotoi TaxID=47466 RepID=UPI001C781728|nr:hypothetical protein [Borrelia miyamotoi]BCR21249.1 Oxygen-independent coproporphyrinogen-III oxidase-like protein [Borrelia miyamotoi]
MDEFTFGLHLGEVTLSILAILNDFSVSRISLDANSFSSKFLGVMDCFRVPVKNINAIVDNIHRFNFLI